MNEADRTLLWNQFGAAIDTLENALDACPEDLWGDRTRRPEFWYLVYHTLFFLDFYLDEAPERFAPPAPFTLGELDPAGVMPDRVYSKDELRRYLEHGRAKGRARIRGLTADKARERFRYGRTDRDVQELMLYSMRHVQHHAAQLNLILRWVTDSAPEWVSKARSGLEAD